MTIIVCTAVIIASMFACTLLASRRSTVSAPTPAQDPDRFLKRFVTSTFNDWTERFRAALLADSGATADPKYISGLARALAALAEVKTSSACLAIVNELPAKMEATRRVIKSIGMQPGRRGHASGTGTECTVVGCKTCPQDRRAYHHAQDDIGVCTIPGCTACSEDRRLPL